MSHTYSHLYGMRLTGLRFFTVYGPWGRPDMAVWGFTEAILAGRAIPVFNGGHLKRDFTFIDDIAAGVLAVAQGPIRDDAARHRIYNIGNNRPEDLMQMIGLLEEALGRRAIKEYLPAQPGDLTETCADITAIQTDYGYTPSTPISVGIPAFARWYMDRYGTAAAA
jgi:UDP-glucuronate 4-epimerase